MDKDRSVADECLLGNIQTDRRDEDKPAPEENSDAVFQCSCNALALGLLALNFNDARKHADRERP